MAADIVIALDLNDIKDLINGKEVTVSGGGKSIAILADEGVMSELNMAYRKIGILKNEGHKVLVDGREYVDKIVFQEHLEEQILYMMGEKHESIH